MQDQESEDLYLLSYETDSVPTTVRNTYLNREEESCPINDDQ